MIILNIRKQGGAAVITLPSDILKLLNIQIGDSLGLDIDQGKLVIHPINQHSQRYSLTELLAGVTQSDIKAMKEETKWFRDEDATGREIL